MANFKVLCSYIKNQLDNQVPGETRVKIAKDMSHRFNLRVNGVYVDDKNELVYITTSFGYRYWTVDPTKTPLSYDQALQQQRDVTYGWQNFPGRTVYKFERFTSSELESLRNYQKYLAELTAAKKSLGDKDGVWWEPGPDGFVFNLDSYKEGWRTLNLEVYNARICGMGFGLSAQAETGRKFQGPEPEAEDDWSPTVSTAPTASRKAPALV